MAQLQQVWNECCSGKTKVVINKSLVRCKQQTYLFGQLEERSKNAAFDCLRLKRLLDAMQKRYQQLEARLLFIQLLQQANEDKSRDVVFRYRASELLKAIDFCSPEKQQLLAFRLEIAKATKKVTDKAIKRLTVQEE